MTFILMNVRFIFRILKGVRRGVTDAALKLHGYFKEIIRERRAMMFKNATPLNADLLNILLSTQDEDLEVTDDIIIGTLQV